MNQYIKKTLSFFILIIGCAIPISLTFFLTQLVVEAVPKQEQVSQQDTANGIVGDFVDSNQATQSAQTVTQMLIQEAAPEQLVRDIAQIESKDELILLTLTNNRTAILDANPESLAVQLTRLELVLRGLDFDTIDAPIVEIDVRYKLPVLRTQRSY